MKMIIAGGRDFMDMGGLSKVMYSLKKWPDEIVCGEANGADRLGKLWAQGRSIKVASFPADWSAHGRGAGHIRNREMAEYSDALLAFWDGESKGTENMIEEATKLGLFVKVVYYTKETRQTEYGPEDFYTYC